MLYAICESWNYRILVLLNREPWHITVTPYAYRHLRRRVESTDRPTSTSQTYRSKCTYYKPISLSPFIQCTGHGLFQSEEGNHRLKIFIVLFGYRSRDREKYGEEYSVNDSRVISFVQCTSFKLNSLTLHFEWKTTLMVVSVTIPHNYVFIELKKHPSPSNVRVSSNLEFHCEFMEDDKSGKRKVI